MTDKKKPTPKSSSTQTPKIPARPGIGGWTPPKAGVLKQLEEEGPAE